MGGHGNCEGTGSRAQVGAQASNSSVVTGLKEENIECGGCPGMLVGGESWAVEILPRIVSILFLKLLAISWAVIRLVCGGRGS